MKYLLTMVLALAFAVPASAQRIPVDHGKGKVERVGRVWSTVDQSISCPKCAALKKEIAGLRKRLQKATEGHTAPKGRPGTRGKRGEQSSRGKRGGRSVRGRSSRPGSERSTPRRSGPPSKKGSSKIKKGMEARRKGWLDVNSNERKKMEDLIKKRLKVINEEARKIDWRKFAQARK